MKICAIQNQSQSHIMPYRKSNENRLSFQGFDVQIIGTSVINRLKSGHGKNGAYIKNPDEAQQMITEADNIFEALDLFKKAQFNLHDYEDRFTEHKKTAFGEFINQIGEGAANDFPVIIDNRCNKPGPPEFHYMLPEVENIKITHYKHPSPWPDSVSVFPEQRSIDFRYPYDEMYGKAEYFEDFPKSVDAIKKFVIDCIERIVLNPRVKELEREDAMKLVEAAANKLRTKVTQLS